MTILSDRDLKTLPLDQLLKVSMAELAGRPGDCFAITHEKIADNPGWSFTRVSDEVNRLATFPVKIGHDLASNNLIILHKVST